MADTPEAYWTTGSGEKILVSKMSNDHLRNSIVFCNRTIMRIKDDLGAIMVMDAGVDPNSFSSSALSQVERDKEDALEMYTTSLGHLVAEVKRREEQ